MNALFFGFSCIMFSFFLHLIIWHIRLPQKHIKTLFFIFTLGPLSFVILHWLFTFSFMPQTSWQWIEFLIFYIPLSLVYFSLYTLLENHSPTITLIEIINKSGGIAEEQAVDFFNKSDIISIRITHMLKSGMIVQTSDGCRLTKYGYCLAFLFRLTRTILGIKRGG